MSDVVYVKLKVMKRITIILIAILFCSLQGKAQFWISFGWNEPHCQNCLWMEQAIRMNNRQAADYHKIIHKYGQKIEKEARKHYRYWDQSARAIYNLRMERDRRLQRILSPSQFRLYVRFVRERPTRIHDYQGWFNNPHYPSYRPTDVCFRYEDHYWHSQWEYRNDRWHDRFDAHSWYRGKYDRPGHNDRPHFDNNRPNHSQDRPNFNEGSNGNRDKFDRDHSDKKEKDKNQRYERSRRSDKDKKDSKDRKDRDDRTNRSDQSSRRTKSI